MKPLLRIGTSGWNYNHWHENFYPSDQPKSKWLEYYCQYFNTVEVNATFYRLPKAETFEKWHKRTPANFLWAVKASRYLTHIRRLKEPKEPLDRFYQATKHLREKLGPLLFQLPPNMHFDEELLCEFCQALEPTQRHTLEVRHASWIDDRLFSMLQRYHIAFCISDTAGRFPYHEAVTADFIYIRLHGSKQLYASDYSEEELQTWSDKIRKWNKDTYVYFDNDFNGYAPKNAKYLLELLD